MENSKISSWPVLLEELMTSLKDANSKTAKSVGRPFCRGKNFSLTADKVALKSSLSCIILDYTSLSLTVMSSIPITWAHII